MFILQPKFRPLNRSVAFIHANVPADVDGNHIWLALDVQSPWSAWDENTLSDWLEEEARTGAAKATHLMHCVLENELKPFFEPPTLSPIWLDGVELICWLAVTPKAAVQ